jgi:hypothetical protein
MYTRELLEAVAIKLNIKFEVLYRHFMRPPISKEEAKKVSLEYFKNDKGEFLFNPKTLDIYTYDDEQRYIGKFVEETGAMIMFEQESEVVDARAIVHLSK